MKNGYRKEIQALINFRHELHTVQCPECRNIMYLRNGKFGKFWGCSKYPKCTGTTRYDEPHK